jgi:hypothetical protein
MALAGLAVCLGSGATAQDSSGQSSSGQSLGDVARKTRQEHSATGHIAAKQRVNEEDDGPDRGGVWRVKSCTRTPCYQLSITLPKNAKWTREKEEPRPVLIPLPGDEPDANRVIRVYAAEWLGGPSSFLDGAKRVFLQSWFARPEYFGQGARILRDEHVPLDAAYGLISHFTVTTGTTKYRGMSIVANMLNGTYGFACVFREEDASSAASVCDAIVRSARNAILEPAQLRQYPTYEDPPGNEPDDQPDDPPDNDDPQ